MSTVRVSPKFQVVIPREVREDLALKPGQKVTVMRVGDYIAVVPLAPLRSLRGSLKGLDTTVAREADRV